jgi:hypothetical protein
VALCSPGASPARPGPLWSPVPASALSFPGVNLDGVPRFPKSGAAPPHRVVSYLAAVTMLLRTRRCLPAALSRRVSPAAASPGPPPQHGPVAVASQGSGIGPRSGPIDGFRGSTMARANLATLLPASIGGRHKVSHQKIDPSCSYVAVYLRGMFHCRLVCRPDGSRRQVDHSNLNTVSDVYMLLYCCRYIIPLYVPTGICFCIHLYCIENSNKHFIL